MRKKKDKPKQDDQEDIRLIEKFIAFYPGIDKRIIALQMGGELSGDENAWIFIRLVRCGEFETAKKLLDTVEMKP